MIVIGIVSLDSYLMFETLDRQDTTAAPGVDILMLPTAAIIFGLLWAGVCMEAMLRRVQARQSHL